MKRRSASVSGAYSPGPKRLGDLARLFTGVNFSRDKARIPPGTSLSPVPVIELSNVQDGRLELAENLSVRDVSVQQLERHGVFPGDVVVACRGSVFKSTLVPVGYPSVVVSSNFIVIRPNPAINPGYVLALLRSSEWQETLVAKSRSSMGILQWTVRDFEELFVPRVDAETQENIARLIELEDRWRCAAQAAIDLRSRHVRSVVAEVVNFPKQLSEGENS